MRTVIHQNLFSLLQQTHRTVYLVMLEYIVTASLTDYVQMFDDMIKRETHLSYKLLIFQMFVLFMKCGTRQDFYVFLSNCMLMFQGVLVENPEFLIEVALVTEHSFIPRYLKQPMTLLHKSGFFPLLLQSTGLEAKQGQRVLSLVQWQYSLLKPQQKQDCLC